MINTTRATKWFWARGKLQRRTKGDGRGGCRSASRSWSARSSGYSRMEEMQIGCIGDGATTPERGANPWWVSGRHHYLTAVVQQRVMWGAASALCPQVTVDLRPIELVTAETTHSPLPWTTESRLAGLRPLN